MSSIGRPLEFDPEVALDSAMAVFWQKGYEASSLQDLLCAMNLSKSSFYQTFDSKRTLFKKCIQRYKEILSEQFFHQLNTANSGKKFIKAVFNSVANEADNVEIPKGCLLMNTANEFSQKDSEISKLVLASVDSLIDIFEQAIKQSQKQGDMPIDKNPHSVATYLVTSISGLRNMIKAGVDRQSIDEVILLTLLVLD